MFEVIQVAEHRAVPAAADGLPFVTSLGKNDRIQYRGLDNQNPKMEQEG